MFMRYGSEIEEDFTAEATNADIRITWPSGYQRGAACEYSPEDVAEFITVLKAAVDEFNKRNTSPPSIPG